jgi:hypothetical protein
MYIPYICKAGGIAPLFLTLSMKVMLAVEYSIKKQIDFSDV